MVGGRGVLGKTRQLFPQEGNLPFQVEDKGVGKHGEALAGGDGEEKGGKERSLRKFRGLI